MATDFIAPALRDTRSGAADADRADHLIFDDERKSAGIREEADLDPLQFRIGILNHGVH